MTSTIASYQAIVNDLRGALERTANTPQVARATAYYLEGIVKVATIDAFLADRRLVSYALKAFGLDEADTTTAFVRKVLTEGTIDPGSLACAATESRFREFAAVFDFGRLGAMTTGTRAAQAGTVEKYVRQTLEEEAGTRAEGVRLALYFQRKAPDIANAYQILADPILLDVACTALGFTPRTAATDIERQAALLSSLIDFSDFQDDVRLRAFIQRFAVLWDIGNPQPETSATQIVAGHPITMGVSTETMMTLQALKLGK